MGAQHHTTTRKKGGIDPSAATGFRHRVRDNPASLPSRMVEGQNVGEVWSRLVGKAAGPQQFFSLEILLNLDHWPMGFVRLCLLVGALSRDSLGTWI